MTDDHRPPDEAPFPSTTDDADSSAPVRGSTSTPQPPSSPRRSRRNTLLTAGASAVLGALAVSFAGQAQPTSPDSVWQVSNTPAPAVSGTNSSGGPGLEGNGTDGDGVIGRSTSGRGLYGKSSSGDGVYGKSTDGRGVYGQSNQSYGVVGESGEIGVYGKSTRSYGVYGESTSNAGVFGISGPGSLSSGVYGTSDRGPGVSGQSARGPGVYGSAANGNVAVKAENFDGDLAFQAIGHLGSLGRSPAVAAGAQAGSNAPAPVAGGGATDTKGSLSFGTGTFPSAGAQILVTFHRAYGTTPVVILTPTNEATQKLGLYVAATPTGFTVSTANAPSASQPNTTYGCNYLVVQ